MSHLFTPSSSGGMQKSIRGSLRDGSPCGPGRSCEQVGPHLSFALLRRLLTPDTQNYSCILLEEDGGGTPASYSNPQGTVQAGAWCGGGPAQDKPFSHPATCSGFCRSGVTGLGWQYWLRGQRHLDCDCASGQVWCPFPPGVSASQPLLAPTQQSGALPPRAAGAQAPGLRHQSTGSQPSR